jgi:hypothetical protein
MHQNNLYSIEGINTIMYYSATILRAVGFRSASEAIWLSAGVAFFNFLGCFVGFFFVERYGRRPLTLASLFLVIISLVFIAIAYYVAETGTMTVGIQSDKISGSCSGYSYCFDCIQDLSCGFCSSLQHSEEKMGSVCIPVDKLSRSSSYGAMNNVWNATNSNFIVVNTNLSCAENNYYEINCPGLSHATQPSLCTPSLHSFIDSSLRLNLQM